MKMNENFSKSAFYLLAFVIDIFPIMYHARYKQIMRNGDGAPPCTFT